MKKAIIIALLALVALTTFGQGNNIADTYWRNEQTGDWQIGFAEKHVIYNNKVWEIVSQTEKKDAYTLTVDNGETIKVGKAKNGQRTIAIGNGKPVVCSQITTATLPDYPTKDLTPFKDNDYRAGDTATVIGWLKDWPAEALGEKREIRVYVYKLFDYSTDKRESIACGKVDSLGRFTVKIPVENTQHVDIFPNITTALEPGETYFLVNDHKTGQRLMMGRSARVQNELLAHSIYPKNLAVPATRSMTQAQAIDMKNRLASAHERNMARVDSLLARHPMLSRRCEDFLRMFMLCRAGESIMGMTEDFNLPAEVVGYVDSQIWPNVRKPYTLNYYFNDFLCYHRQGAMGNLPLPHDWTGDPLATAFKMTDALYADPQLRDISKAQQLCAQIEMLCAPLTESQLALAEQIQRPGIRQKVLSLNDQYCALQQRDIRGGQSLRANSDVADMSDGEKILRKIIEPYRGRLILLDVWGTWCGPCKEALSHSKEEFERLKDYNLVYLYLANRSSDESWKNVIKEYDLMGDDIVHYNLPADQQSAIENFLNVHAFPTYKLIDRDGTVLDVNADPRNLEGLARLLEKLK